MDLRSKPRSAFPVQTFYSTPPVFMKSYPRILFLLTISIAAAMLIVVKATAQNPRLSSNFSQGRGHGPKGFYASDSIDEKSVPKGLFVWSVDERFGGVVPQRPDTFMTHFQNHNYTEGVWGDYNFTGNLGGPRVSRLYRGDATFQASQFVFFQPYNWFIEPVSQFRFTNTKSPIATLNYDMAGSKIDGDDHLEARFATNINKRAGIGFTANYIYGLGYYRHNNHSSVGGNLYGSYRGDRYQMHAIVGTHHIKNLENGGLENDAYVNNPESFSTNYSPADMPVRLEGVRNSLNLNRLFLSHRYSLGFYEWHDKAGKVVGRKAQQALSQPADSVDSTSLAMMKDTALVRSFIPVAAMIHTVKIEDNERQFSDQFKHDGYFLNHYVDNENGKALDEVAHQSIQNTFALEMQEGFRSWIKTGIRLFAKHEWARFTLPNRKGVLEHDDLNYITLGAQLMREKGHVFRYNVIGETRTTGEDWGEFNLEGKIGFNIPLRNDSLQLRAGGYVCNKRPDYFLRHHHGRNAWWDKELDKVFRVRLEGTLAYRRTALTVGLESIQNYAFLQEIQQLTTLGNTATAKYGVMLQQSNKNLQVVSAALHQDFTLGIFNWENKITLQQSSDESLLPLPLLNVWSNVYLRFKIAGVLDTELGADVRYFTRYYAPTYSVAVGQYALQDQQQRSLLGSYPWVNAYVNFKLKGVRFYVAYSHVNQGAGNYFLVPHYPTNERTLRFGVSWNFYN